MRQGLKIAILRITRGNNSPTIQHLLQKKIGQAYRMEKQQTFILWGCEDLISKAIEDLLAAHDEWKVLRVSNQESYEALSVHINFFSPEAVIIAEAEHDRECTVALKLLQDHPNLKVITLSLENNLLEIFTKQNVRVKTVSDLISVIEN